MSLSFDTESKDWIEAFKKLPPVFCNPGENQTLLLQELWTRVWIDSAPDKACCHQALAPTTQFQHQAELVAQQSHSHLEEVWVEKEAQPVVVVDPSGAR